MLFKRYKRPNADGFTSVISHEMTIEGNILYHGTVLIQGTVRGDIMPLNHNEHGGVPPTDEHGCAIILDEGSKVTAAMVEATDMTVGGELIANEVHVRGVLFIRSTAVIKCTKLYYDKLEVEPGAVIHDTTLVQLANVPTRPGKM
jgi:cytoskeletal protein CcmA (bactofilin family)